MTLKIFCNAFEGMVQELQFTDNLVRKKVISYVDKIIVQDAFQELLLLLVKAY